MTLTIILNIVLMILVFAAIVALLGAGIMSNRRWAASLAAPARRQIRTRPVAREVAGRRVAQRGYTAARSGA
jgi:hypothetical protein